MAWSQIVSQKNKSFPGRDSSGGTLILKQGHRTKCINDHTLTLTLKVDLKRHQNTKKYNNNNKKKNIKFPNPSKNLFKKFLS
jgi:hypothetical protein